MLAKQQERARKAAQEKAKLGEDEAKAAGARERERAALAKALEAEAGGDASSIGGASMGTAGGSKGLRKGAAIEAVLTQRHSKETTDLVARQYAERTDELQAALEDVLEQKHAQKTELLAEWSERVEAARLLDDGGQERVRVEKERDMALEDLKLEWEEKQKDAEESVRGNLETKHAQEQLQLKQRQLAEIAGTLEQLAPEETGRRQVAQEAEREANELQRF